MDKAYREKKILSLVEKYKQGYFTTIYGNDEILVFANDTIKRCINITGIDEEFWIEIYNGRGVNN